MAGRTCRGRGRFPRGRRGNGYTVMEYDRLQNVHIRPIALQAHDTGRWTEYEHILIRPI